MGWDGDLPDVRDLSPSYLVAGSINVGSLSKLL